MELPEYRVSRVLHRMATERLAAARDIELEIEQLDTSWEPDLGAEDHERLMALGRDLVRAWESSGTTLETRKKIIRTIVAEIIVDIVDDHLEFVVHWQGGDHSRLTAKRNRPGQSRWATDTDVVDLVRALARQMPDETIAAVLNRSGKATSHGNSWTRGRICSLRHQYEIAIYRDGERAERGETTLDETATALAVSKSTIRRLIAMGLLPARQHCKGGPWIIRQADLENADVRRQADARRSRRPEPDRLQQNLFDLSTA